MSNASTVPSVDHAARPLALLITACALAAGCGPSIQPYAPLRNLPSGADTAESAGEATSEARDDDSEAVVYASSSDGAAPPTPALPPDARPPSGPDDEQARPPSEAPDRADQPDAPPEADAAPAARTYVLERRDDRITVRHGPHTDEALVGAFERASRLLQSPDRTGLDDETTSAWDPSWQADRLQIDEVASVADEDGEERVEFRGSAASEDDLDEFLTRLESLPSFSSIELADSEPTREGQGVRFRLSAAYDTEASQPPSD